MIVIRNIIITDDLILIVRPQHTSNLVPDNGENLMYVSLYKREEVMLINVGRHHISFTHARLLY
jgi:hypothetical protein